MPGKVNPVIPEAATQAAMMVMGFDQVVAVACGMGSLELNPFLPLVAHALLSSLDLLERACYLLRVRCVEGIEADEARCRRHVESSTAVVTALVGEIGYKKAEEIAREMKATGATAREIATRRWGLMTPERFDELTSPEAVTRLGS